MDFFNFQYHVKVPGQKDLFLGKTRVENVLRAVFLLLVKSGNYRKSSHTDHIILMCYDILPTSSKRNIWKSLTKFDILSVVRVTIEALNVQ